MNSDTDDTTHKLSRMDVIRFLMPWPFHRELPECPNGEKPKIDFGDLVLSVLPWPFHRDLPSPCRESKEGANVNLSK